MDRVKCLDQRKLVSMQPSRARAAKLGGFDRERVGVSFFLRGEDDEWKDGALHEQGCCRLFFPSIDDARTMIVKATRVKGAREAREEESRQVDTDERRFCLI